MKTKIQFFLIIIYSILLNKSMATQNGAIVGSLPGIAGVDLYGAATYTIPIWVTPGTNGMQPNLSLVYNSRSGRGIMGVGWGIQGLSSITRTGKDWMHFGQTTGMNVSVNDRYHLDGNLLLATNGGIYHQGGTEYGTEIETFSKIYSVGNSGAGPDHFNVYSKEGTILEYGNTPDSKVELPNSITALIWQINRATDANGNYMTYTYNESNGESTLQRIEYTFNQAQGLAAYASVEFEYINSGYPNYYYVDNEAIGQTKLLSAIYIKYGNAITKKYTFIYDTGFPRRLTEIK